MKVTIGVSNRHVHLTEEVYKYLFNGKDIEKRNDLNQIGEFASTDTIDLKFQDKVIEHVRVLGPYRSACQVELLGSDIDYLGIDVPTRRSGDLDNTPGITLVNKDKSYNLSNGVIRAERHVHVSAKDSEKLGLFERDMVILSKGETSFDAFVKVSDNAYFEVHIDKDEAKEYNVTNGEEVELVKCGK